MPFFEYFIAVVTLSILIGLIVSFAFSILIVHLYKRAVIKGMGFNSLPAKNNINDEDRLVGEYLINQPGFLLKDGNGKSLLKSLKYQKLQKFLSRNILIHAISNLCFGFAWTLISLQTIVYFFVSPLFTILDYLVIFCWPFVFLVNSIWARGRKQKTLTYGSYGLIYVASVIFIYFNQTQYKLWQLLLPFFVYNVLPSFLIILLRFSKIKTISLTIFLFCFISVFTCTITLAFFEYTPQAQVSQFINNNSFLSVIAQVVIFLLPLFIAALAIRGLIKLYLAKYINEQQISMDVQLLIFSLSYSIWVIKANPSITTVIYCTFPFVIYKIISLLLFKVFQVKHQNRNPANLLLLRVFALAEQSRISFEKLQVHWQFSGSVLMISGPDLATTTLGPHEMVSFLTNNLKKHFCQDSESMDKNLSEADFDPDNDGSYRVTELFCRNNLWKQVLLKLVAKSNVVLLDLRSFSEVYKGCQYEIEQVVNHISISKVVVLVDEYTKMDFLKATFTNAFKNIQRTSPNLSEEKHQVQLYSFKPGNSKNFSDLLKVLSSVTEN